MNFREELDTAVEAVRQASLLCRSVQSQLDPATLRKDDRSPVTVADFGSQAVICRVLGAVFPDDPVIAEEDSAALRNPDNSRVLERVIAEVRAVIPNTESCDVTDWIDRGNAAEYSDRFWTLDPIDGTKGFLRGDQYAVALGLIIEGELAVAALACPKLEASGTVGSIFSAVSGHGAQRSPIEDTGNGSPIHVSDVTDPSEARFCESVESAHSSHGQAAALAAELGIQRDPYRIDSQAKYAVVAAGEAEIYLRLTRHTGYVENIWDHAAGALVIEEAGGQVTDLNGKRLDFSRGTHLENNIGIVASNGRFHQHVLDALEKVRSHSLD